MSTTTLQGRLSRLLAPAPALTEAQALERARTTESTREVRSLIRLGLPAVHEALAARLERFDDKTLVLLGTTASDAVFARVSAEVTARQYAAHRNAVRRPTR